MIKRDLIRARLGPIWGQLQTGANKLIGTFRGHYYAASVGQRTFVLAVLAILLVGGVATLSLTSNKNPTISAPLPTDKQKIVLSAPPRPTPQIVAPAEPTTAAQVSEATSPTEATATAPAPLLADVLRAAQNATVTMPPAPVSELTVATPDGLLPKIGPNGQTPWQAYARPWPAAESPLTQSVPTNTPRLAILLLDMGLSERLTMPALELLPGQVSIVLNAHSGRLAEYLAAARQDGHEVILDLPAEPRFYPEENPGPDALLTRNSNEQNLKNLRQWLARSTGSIGVTSSTGTYFLQDARAATPMLNELALRGMAWFDLNEKNATAQLAASLAVTHALATHDFDQVQTPARMRAAFAAAMAHAQQQGQALLVVRPYPLSISLLQQLLNTLPDSGIALVPASALLRPQSAAQKPTVETPSVPTTDTADTPS